MKNRSLSRSFNVFDMMDRLFNMQWPIINEETNLGPIQETESSYIIKAIVPGFEEKDLNVTVRGNLLIISGKIEKTETKDQFVSSENSSFERSYIFPQDAELDNVSADYRAGVLAISVPRKTTHNKELKTVPIKSLGAGEIKS